MVKEEKTMKGVDFNRFDPRPKMFLSIGIGILAILSPDLFYLLVLLLTTLLLSTIGLMLKRLLKYLYPFRYLIPLIFVLNLFFYAGGETLWSFFILAVTTDGIYNSLVIIIRLLTLAGTAAWFAINTNPERFEIALVKLKVPWRLAFTFSLTLRLVPEMKKKFEKIETAQQARGLTIEGNPFQKAKARIPMFIPFLSSVIRYGYDLAEALKARNFEVSKKRTYLLQLKQTKLDYLLYGLSTIFFVIFLIFKYSAVGLT